MKRGLPVQASNAVTAYPDPSEKTGVRPPWRRDLREAERYTRIMINTHGRWGWSDADGTYLFDDSVSDDTIAAFNSAHSRITEIEAEQQALLEALASQTAAP